MGPSSILTSAKCLSELRPDRAHFLSRGGRGRECCCFRCCCCWWGHFLSGLTFDPGPSKGRLQIYKQHVFFKCLFYSKAPHAAHSKAISTCRSYCVSDLVVKKVIEISVMSLVVAGTHAVYNVQAQTTATQHSSVHSLTNPKCCT